MSNKSRRKVINEPVLHFHEDYSKIKSVHQISGFFFVAGLFYVLFSIYISRCIIDATPDLKDTNIPFVGAQAWKDLNELNDIGPKVSGTHENEIIAANMIKSRIAKIMNRANAAQTIEFDHQIVSGSFFLGFKPIGSTSVYRSVQNLVVKLHGQSETKYSLMLNCHFDSVYGSFGANDDIANCAIMLELISILSSRDVKLKHDIIFLFNGAEEIGLRASHGFITKHKWAKDVRVVINLEAAGSGGKEILFQTGPGNSWLLNHYHAVGKPFAQVSSEEVFQSGLIPSDTDFRIFRDFGNVVGLDFAHVAKGYRYHTKYDHVRFLSQGFVQRTGENVLALTLSIANGNELDHPEAFSKDDFAVYFDYLGMVFVHYTKEMGAIINFVIAILSITIPFLTLKRATSSAHSKHILKETLLGFLSILLGVGFSLLICYLLGYFLDKAGHSMTWYRNTSLAFGIYGSATILALILAFDVIDRHSSNSNNSPISLGLKVQARINGVSIWWSVLMLGITILGFRSGYLFMLLLVFKLNTIIVIYFLGLQNSVRSWLKIFVFGQIFGLLWSSYFLNVVADVFIPITGRQGSNTNPESLVSILFCVTTIFIVSYLIPLTLLLKGKAIQYLTILSLLLSSIFLATSTNYGFPYQDDSTNNPTPQRHHILHTVRNLYGFDGNLRHADGGYLFIEWDRNAIKTIEGVTMPEQLLSPSEMCNNEVLCALPYVQSRMLMLGLKWLPSKEKPKVRDQAVIDSHAKFNIGDNLVKFVFFVNSSSLSAVYVKPRGENEMHSWSFSDTFEDISNKTYFCSVANGLQEKIEPLKFDITLKVNSKLNFEEEALLDVTLVTIQSNEAEFSPNFSTLIKRFPPWTFPVPLTASVNAYSF